MPLDTTMMSLKFHIQDIMLAFLKRTTWLTCRPTSTYGKKLTVLVYWVPFICSCRSALCVWHSLVASHFITRILTTRILLITCEVTFAAASNELKRERVKEFVPKKSSTCIWGVSVYRIFSASIASCFSRLRARERPSLCSLAEGKCFFQSTYVTIVTWHNVFFFRSARHQLPTSQSQKRDTVPWNCLQSLQQSKKEEFQSKTRSEKSKRAYLLVGLSYYIRSV